MKTIIRLKAMARYAIRKRIAMARPRCYVCNGIIDIANESHYLHDNEYTRMHVNCKRVAIENGFESENEIRSHYTLTEVSQ